jgi:hypothetical protein
VTSRSLKSLMTPVTIFGRWIYSIAAFSTTMPRWKRRKFELKLPPSCIASWERTLMDKSLTAFLELVPLQIGAITRSCGI